jgi:[amino group carrier protein]-lysine/ornithine hydrolase
MTVDRGPKTEEGGKFKTLIELVEWYSPSGKEAAAVEYLVERMQSLGFERSYVDDVGNAIGIMGDGPRQIVLLGHIDTVPGEIPVRISQLPEGEGPGVRVLHGRGSVDAKGPLATFVDAAANTGAVAGWQFVVIGAINEERNSVGARHIVNHYRPNFAIIGEPSRWDRVTLGYKGSAWAEVNVQRSMEHTAGQGESAPEAAAEIWQRIRAWAEEFNQQHERTFDKVLPTLRGFSSGTDDFQAWATLQIGVRLPEELNPAQWYQKLQELASAPGADIQTSGFPIPAYRAERNSALVRAFLGGIRAEGGKPGFVVKTGTADLNIVAPVWGCPAVAYGPGDSSLDHTPTEHISLAEYRQAVAVLSSVLKKLSTGV